MANVFSQDPLILDTGWTSSIPAALTDGTVQNQSFRRVVWVDPAAAGDTVTIADANGNVILKAAASAAHEDVVLWDAGVTRKTLSLKQGKWQLAISSGALYLYR